MSLSEVPHRKDDKAGGGGGGRDREKQWKGCSTTPSSSALTILPVPISHLASLLSWRNSSFVGGGGRSKTLGRFLICNSPEPVLADVSFAVTEVVRIRRTRDSSERNQEYVRDVLREKVEEVVGARVKPEV